MTSQEEIRRRVTEEIVAALKSGSRLPWSRPWCDLENTGLPTNVVSENPYSGVNVLLLMLVSQSRGYTSKFWGTFNQWQSLGFQVMKRPDHIPAWQYGTRCILFKPITKATKNGKGEEEEERFFLLREFTLFNAEQVTGPGVEDYLAKPRNTNGFLDYEPAEQAIAATGADIRFGGDRAFYRMTEDFIQLPPKAAFRQSHRFYEVATHALCHCSGHPCRLDRLDKLARFGDASYAMEELVAEMGAAFLMTELGLPQSDDLSNVTTYLASWLGVLERDHNAIFTASTAASKAADFILRFSKATEKAEAVNQPEAMLAQR